MLNIYHKMPQAKKEKLSHKPPNLPTQKSKLVFNIATRILANRKSNVLPPFLFKNLMLCFHIFQSFL